MISLLQIKVPLWLVVKTRDAKLALFLSLERIKKKKTACF